MNLANILTFLRAIVSFLVAILLCIDCKYLTTVALVLFILAGSTDWLDGYIARKYNMVTNLGRFMDSLIDKIMVIGMFLVLLGLSMYEPGWTIFAIFCAFISSAREFFVSGIRMLAAKEGVVLAAENLGKYKAALQMYSIGSIIFAYMLRVDYSNFADTIVYSCFYYFTFYGGLFCFGLSTVLSLISGIGYGIRYSYLLKG